MPRQSWQKNTNRGRKKLPQNLPSTLKCVKTYIPDDKEYVGLFIGALNRLAMQSIYDRDETHKAKEVATVWKVANQETFAVLADGCGSEMPPGGGGGGGGQSLPGCIEVIRNGSETIVNIKECECEEMVIVNVYECGCGCGDSGNGGSGSGGSGGSGSGSGSGYGGDTVGGGVTPYGQQNVTPCDVAQTTIPYIWRQVHEFFLQVQTGVNAGLILPDAIASGADIVPVVGDIVEISEQAITDQIQNCLDDVVNVTDDSDLILRSQEIFIEVYGANIQIKTLDRGGLRQWALKLPLIWGSLIDGCIVSPRLLMGAMVQVLDISKINSRLQLAKGTGTDVLCNYLYGTTGIERPATTPPPTEYESPPTEVIVISPDLEIYVYDLSEQLTVAPSTLEIATHNNIVAIGINVESTVQAGVQQLNTIANGLTWMSFDPDLTVGGHFDLTGDNSYFPAFKAAMPDYAGVTGNPTVDAPDSGQVQLSQTTSTPGYSQIIDVYQVAIMVDKSL